MSSTVSLRIATYNVHGCVGRGGLDVGRVADVVASLECDVVALQEVDVGRPRSGGVDQATRIAERIAAHVAFGEACDFGDGGSYGNAILSRWPIDRSHTHALPVSRGLRCEPRSVLAATVETPHGALRAWCTHLGVRGYEREAQGHTILGHVASALGESDAPMVLLGDLNAGVDTPLVREIATHLVDVRRRTTAPTATFPAILPLFALDHAFVSAPFVVRDVSVPRTSATVTASDHLPLVVTLDWPLRARNGPPIA